MNPERKQDRVEELYALQRENLDWFECLQLTPNPDDHTYRLIRDTKEVLADIDNELQQLLGAPAADDVAASERDDRGFSGNPDLSEVQGF